MSVGELVLIRVGHDDTFFQVGEHARVVPDEERVRHERQLLAEIVTLMKISFEQYGYFYEKPS